MVDIQKITEDISELKEHFVTCLTPVKYLLSKRDKGGIITDFFVNYTYLVIVGVPCYLYVFYVILLTYQ